MQQPDCRDQPEPDEGGEDEESSRPVNKSENQESSRMEPEDKETDGAAVSSVITDTTSTDFCWGAESCFT